MSFIYQKQEIFGNILAKKTLCEGMPKLQYNPSFPSVNNDTNTLNFLSDLLGSLVGIESLKEVVIDSLSHNLEDIELDIKKVLKVALNNIISCDINPSIPDNILHKNYNPNSKGVDLELGKIDFNNIFLMDPTSPSGKLIFSDSESGVNSKDFNSFLFATIQSGQEEGWGSSMLDNNILDIKFNEYGSTNNTLNVKVSEYYSNPANKKKLKDLNNDYIDSIDLLDARELLNKIIDNIFGTISVDQERTRDQLMQEAKINAIIDAILNQEDDIEIDNSYFEFDNDDLTDLELQVDSKLKGEKIVRTSTVYGTSTNINNIADATNPLQDASKNDLPKFLNDAIDKISNDVVSNIPEIDKYTVKLDFIQDIVKNIMRTIGSILLSPKITTILALNFQIIHGQVFENPIDFIVNNKHFMKTVFNGIRETILQIILAKTLKEINELALKSLSETQSEKIKSTKATIASLVGVPFEVTQMMSGILK
jgi:hypothetical protein